MEEKEIISMVKRPTERPKRFKGYIEVLPRQIEEYKKKGWEISDKSERICGGNND